MGANLIDSKRRRHRPAAWREHVVDPQRAVRAGASIGWLRGVLGVGTIACGVRFLLWQISVAPPTILGAAFILASAWSFIILVVTLLALADRGHRPAPGRPTGTLDVFVTVCGEPLADVDRAIRSALAIDYPHRTVVLNDGRITQQADWREVDQLASALGVPVITRTTGRRAKAANLNHALAYSTADFVATIDADHVARLDFATRLLRWFSAPDVAFVTSRQQFTADRRDVLNNRQTFFYAFIQPAKDASWCAISCGSGVVYRRTALDSIGGFSEWNIVEDLHTSYRLHAAGWTSAHSRRRGF